MPPVSLREQGPELGKGRQRLRRLRPKTAERKARMRKRERRMTKPISACVIWVRASWVRPLSEPLVIHLMAPQMK